MFERATKFVKDVVQGKPFSVRSPEWHKVEKAHLKKESKCQWCGGDDKLQVHHIKPFHVNPADELDANNLITLCEVVGKDCHLLYGHTISVNPLKGNFKNGCNLNVKENCKEHKPPTEVTPLPQG